MPFKHRLFNRLRTLLSFMFLVFLCVKARPSSLHFSAGLFFLTCGGLLRVWATGHIQKITRLATSGPYRYVRHPLYAGNFLMGLGFCVFANQWYFFLLFALLCILFYYPLILEEEKFLQKAFPEYKVFAREVPRFIPRFFSPREKAQPSVYSFAQAKKNREPLTFIVVFLFYLLLGLKSRVLTFSF